MAFNTEIKREKTSQRLQGIVNSYGMRPIELSKATGIHRSSISRYLSGRYTPSRENAKKLAELLKVSPEWLMGDEDIANLHELTDIFNNLNEEGRALLVRYSKKLTKNKEYRIENTIAQ